jgi:hypothetical protein
MVYPVPNATNVPDTFNVTGVIVADSSGANYNNANGVYFAEFSTAPTAVANYNSLRRLRPLRFQIPNTRFRKQTRI